MKKNLILLLIPVLLLSGCVINIKTSSGSDGGVYKTVDYGDNWEQVTLIYRVGDLERNFNSLDLTAMEMDPTDNQAIYVGTADQGIFYTYNGGEGWFQTLQNDGQVNDIAVDPQHRCIVYAAIGNEVYKTSDCSRHWSRQLIETRDSNKNQITSIAIDSYNTNNIYVGTSGNGLFKSEDAGFSWQTIKFFDSRVNKVLVNPNDTRIIYVSIGNDGIYRSSDSGQSWRLITSEQLTKEKANLLVYREMIMDPTVEDGLFYASQYGLLRTADGGNSWQDIELLTPPSTATIYSLAINPSDGQEIYYGIGSALYRSIDGGVNWITKSLPTSKAAKFLFVDPANPSVLYLGVKKIK